MVKDMMSYCLKNTYFLQHHGSYALLGVSAEGKIYAEAFDDDEVTYFLAHAGKLETLAQAPEKPLIAPTASPQTEALNYRGARWRGLQAEDRIRETALPLTIPEKMQLVEDFNLKLMPPQMIGIAESHVISDVALIPDARYLVCRRLRIAYALMQPQQDEAGQPYDYDTMTFHVAQIYDAGDDLHLGNTHNTLWGKRLTQPLDCVQNAGKLVLLDGSDIHEWEGNDA